MDFGDVAQGMVKSKYLRITNINAIPMNLKEIIKQSLDDVSIDLAKVIDGRSNEV
jgi:hypothetical protein